MKGLDYPSQGQGDRCGSGLSLAWVCPSTQPEPNAPHWPASPYRQPGPSPVPSLACSWCSMPMLTVLTRMAIMMPLLKYLLSTIPRSLARVSLHTSPHSRAAPSSCFSSFPKPEEAPSSLLWGPSPSASASAEPPEPEPSWPESVLPRPEGRLPASCWQRGQLLGSEVRRAEMGCTRVWGVGSRGLCRRHSSEKQTESRISVQTRSPAA